MRSHAIASAFFLLAAYAVDFAAGNEDEPKNVDQFIARSADGRLRLEVEIYRPKENECQPTTDADGYEVFLFKGKKADPEYVRRGYAGFITKFEFTWDGKRIDIPPRFWEDLMMPLMGVVRDVDEMSPEELLEFEAGQYDEFRPRLSISSSDTEGTALIEWHRSLLHCDQSAVERWIISKNGAVMRHTFIAPSLGC